MSPSGGAQPRPRRLVALVAAVAVATCGAVVAGQGNVAIALGPVLAAAALAALVALPLRYPVLALIAAALVLENPQERPAMGHWRSPLYPLGSLLFDNLNTLTGVGPLRFSLMDATVFLLLALMVYRRSTHQQREAAGTVQAASCLPPFLLLSLGALVLALAWGLGRGGDFKQSLWQVRQLLFLPLLALLFQGTLRGPRDHRALGLIVVAAACVKALLAAYFALVICRPLGIKPHYATTHSDSLLFCAAAVIVLVRWHERADLRAWLLVLFPLPLVLAGMVFNNRRLVWVELAMALGAIYFLVPWTWLKRKVTRAAVLSLPLLPLYFAVGWGSTSPVFKPVELTRSIISSDADRSTATRDIENYNLLKTYKPHLLLGTGFGHAYSELSVADTISQFFAQYRYVPHNSLLGLWAFAGLVGFSAMWLPLMVTVFLAVRAYPLARAPADRTAALTVVAVVFAHAIHAYGDMGLQSWPAVFLLAGAMAMASKLAVAVGAWPAYRRRLIGVPALPAAPAAAPGFALAGPREVAR